MMSGHGTTATAVRAIKMGAHDYLEKPLVVRAGGRSRRAPRSRAGARELGRPQPARVSTAAASALRRRRRPSRWLRDSAASRSARCATRRCSTASGCTPAAAPAWCSSRCRPTAASTSSPCPRASRSRPTSPRSPTPSTPRRWRRDGAAIKTVEHLLSALHAAGVTNLLVKCHGEVPVLDGSALEFCRTLEADRRRGPGGAARARW